MYNSGINSLSAISNVMYLHDMTDCNDPSAGNMVTGFFKTWKPQSCSYYWLGADQ